MGHRETAHWPSLHLSYHGSPHPLTTNSLAAIHSSFITMSQGILEYQSNKPQPYTLHVDDNLLEITKQKLQLARYPEEQTDVDGDNWSQGAKVDVVKRLADYWKNSYDWRAEEVHMLFVHPHLERSDSLARQL